MDSTARPYGVETTVAVHPVDSTRWGSAEHPGIRALGAVHQAHRCA
ncbi:hypothetical protein ACFWIA_28610 [Streptomyces sp. NPDC127068]